MITTIRNALKTNDNLCNHFLESVSSREPKEVFSELSKNETGTLFFKWVTFQEN